MGYVIPLLCSSRCAGIKFLSHRSGRGAQELQEGLVGDAVL